MKTNRDYALIGDIQHFCVNDGKGIRTTVFFKGCNLRCRWCHNPELISPNTQTLKSEYETREVGKLLSVDEVVSEIAEDKDYYAKGGGATFSGGEPMIFADFIAKAGEKLKSMGINIIIDTAGNVDFSQFEKVLGIADEFLYDVKANNAADYLSHTKGDFENIYSNFKKLILSGAKVIVRIPIIPNFNDGLDYNKKTAKLISAAGAKQAELLPFHRLGAIKYKSLNLEYEYKDIESLSPQQIKFLLKPYKELGIIAKIEK